MAATLNVDILTVIIECFDDISDILSFSLTCSTLRPIATRSLLSIHPVRLLGSESIHKFRFFLLVDPPARAPHIRSLEIYIRMDYPNPERLPEQPDDDSILVDILMACPQLESLLLYFPFGSCPITDYPHLITAIGALQNLHSLSVHTWQMRPLFPFHVISGPIRKISLRCMENGSQARWCPSVLEEFLPRFAPTLEKLELDKFIVNNILPRPLFNMTQYTAVRSLSLGGLSGKPLLDRLQHLFPALDGTLSLGLLDTRVWFFGMTATDSTTFPSIRNENRQAQEGLRTWKKLDRVICDANMLYILGLRCPIRHIMLDCYSYSPYAEYASNPLSHYARDALRENPVPRPKLSVELTPSALTGLDELFSPELAETLTHLTLCLVYTEDFRFFHEPTAEDITHIHWNDILDSMVVAFRPLKKLTSLRVVIRTSLYHAMSVPCTWYSEELIQALRGSAFDFEGAAASLVGSLQSLRYMFLTTSGNLVDSNGETGDTFERWHVSKAWRVAELDPDGMGDGGPMLVLLHDEVAKTIIRNEELVLSYSDRRSAWCQVEDKMLFPEEDSHMS